MKQFAKILKFELKSYFTNKVFVGVTVFLVAVIAVVMFFPRIKEMFDVGQGVPEISGDVIISGSESGDVNEDLSDESDVRPVMLLVSDTAENAQVLQETFSAAFGGYQVKITDGDLESVKEQIIAGEAECAFALKDLTAYTYYVNNLSMYDNNAAVANQVLQNLYRMNAMISGGLSAEAAQEILTAGVISDTVMLGKDQMQNFFYTYVMIFALYMVILLYGQMVATNVATEKSSRAMEVLITSAKPVSMMFGKVIASCLAGFIQLLAVFGSAFICFNLNKAYWDASGIIASLFDMPFELLVYMLIFFVLGFFIYAFMFGAVGSTASKLEDINTSVMPITLLFVAGFLVVMMSMANGSVDTPLMVVCSYIPFTSPMAMFTRIAMSTVPFYEIAISIVLLVGSVVGVGVLSAKIYRVGVLLYGTPPKIGAILKAIRKA